MRRTQAGDRDPGKAEFQLRPGSLVLHFALSDLVPLAEGCEGGIRTPGQLSVAKSAPLTRIWEVRTTDVGVQTDTGIVALQDVYFCPEETFNWRPRGCHLQPLPT